METVGSGSQNKYKSTQSLHELGLDNYPNPEMPESSRLTRKEEKQSLQNLNNRLAGKSKKKKIETFQSKSASQYFTTFNLINYLQD